MSKLVLDSAQREDLATIYKAKRSLDASLPGAGKTLLAVSLAGLVLAEKPDARILVVCEKKTMLSTWVDTFKNQEVSAELKILSPGFGKEVIAPKQVEANANSNFLGEPGVYLVNPESLVRAVIPKHGYDLVVIDEVHFFSNFKSNATIDMGMIKADRVHALTGTPGGNAPKGMYALAKCVFGVEFVGRSFYRWADEWLVNEPIKGRGGRLISNYNYTKEKEPGAFFNTLPCVIKHIDRGYCCPHHPDGFLADVQEYVERFLDVKLSEREWEFYRQHDETMTTTFGSGESLTWSASSSGASKHSRLRQLVLGVPTGVIVSSKVSDAGDLTLSNTFDFTGDDKSTISELVAVLAGRLGEPLVVFSDFVNIFPRVRRVLEREGVSFAVHTGLESESERLTALDDFKSGRAQVLLASIRATGTGLDGLQRVCRNVLVLSPPDGDPVALRQAIRRLYRRGQSKQVRVFYLNVPGSVTEGVWENLIGKDSVMRLATELKK